jgi:hypothetical protein
MDESAWLVGDGVVVRIFERAEWLVSDVSPVGIDIKLRPRRAVLKIVFAAVLGHPCTLEIGLGGLAVGEQTIVVLAEPFPAVPFGMQIEQRCCLTLVD